MSNRFLEAPKATVAFGAFVIFSLLLQNVFYNFFFISTKGWHLTFRKQKNRCFLIQHVAMALCCSYKALNPFSFSSTFAFYG